MSYFPALKEQLAKLESVLAAGVARVNDELRALLPGLRSMDTGALDHKVLEEFLDKYDRSAWNHISPWYARKVRYLLWRSA